MLSLVGSLGQPVCSAIKDSTVEPPSGNRGPDRSLLTEDPSHTLR